MAKSPVDPTPRPGSAATAGPAPHTRDHLAGVASRSSATRPLDTPACLPFLRPAQAAAGESSSGSAEPAWVLRGAGAPAPAEARLLDLPEAVLGAVLNLLDPTSLVRIAAVCRALYAAVWDDTDSAAATRWQRLGRAHLGEAIYSHHAAFARFVRSRLPGAVSSSGSRAEATKAWRPPGRNGLLEGRTAGLVQREGESRIWGRILASSLQGCTRMQWWSLGRAAALASLQNADIAKPDGPPDDLMKGSEDEGAGHRQLFVDSCGGLCGQWTMGNATCLEPPGALPAPRDSLARTGHGAVVVGAWQVLVGGLTEGGKTIIDVLILDNRTLRVWRPHMSCSAGTSAPVPRFRQTLAPIATAKPNPEGDVVIFMFGGYNLKGAVFGPEDAYTLTISGDGSRGLWCQVPCRGSPPSPRFHHTMAVYNSGRSILVFGGEGPEVSDAMTVEEARALGPSPLLHGHRKMETGKGDSWDAGEHDDGGEPWTLAGQEAAEDWEHLHRRVVVYVMDTHSFTWERAITFGTGPGFRLLHCSCLQRCERTGREQFIVVGGFNRAQAAIHEDEQPTVQELQSMRAYALDLGTFRWTQGPLPQGGEGFLPKTRHRACSSLVGPHHMLLMEGARGSTRDYLDDAHILDLRTLAWTRVTVQGNPSDGPSAGQTVEGMIVVGGCIIGTLGIKVTPRLDVLLLGHWTAEELGDVVHSSAQLHHTQVEALDGLLCTLGRAPAGLQGEASSGGPELLASVTLAGGTQHAWSQPGRKRRKGETKVHAVLSLAPLLEDVEEKSMKEEEDGDVAYMTLNLVARINQVRSTFQGQSDCENQKAGSSGGVRSPSRQP